MSIFRKLECTCGTCGNVATVARAESVNADRRPDLRNAILSGSFQAETCAKCGTLIRLPAELTYIDLARGQWILVQAPETLETWAHEETEAQEVFDESFGHAAPGPSREIGEGLTPRLVFGWPALREKLICDDLAMKDTTLEAVKMSIIRHVPHPPLADQTELRLTGGADDTLSFAWIMSETEQEVAGLDVPRSVYANIADAPEPWAPVMAQFAGHMFVDLKRFISG